MAEPLKQPTSLSDAASNDGAPRTARARSERDLGRSSKRPARGQRKSPRSAGASESRPSAKSEVGSRTEPRTEVRPRSSSKGSRPTRSGNGSPQRPRGVKAGSGARILAPLALVIFAIACFTVLSNQDGGSTANTSEKAAATKAAATGAAAKSGPTRSTYRVKPGDSFAAIAEAQGVDVQTLQELNPDIDPRALQPGQKLKLK